MFDWGDYYFIQLQKMSKCNCQKREDKKDSRYPTKKLYEDFNVFSINRLCRKT